MGQGQAMAQIQQRNKQMLESFVEKVMEIMQEELLPASGEHN